MFASVGLTISGLVFTSLIAIVYLTKKRYFNIQNSVFKFLLILTITLLVLEIYCVYFISIRDIHPLINEIMARIYIFGLVTWFASIVIYVWLLDKPNKYNENRLLIFKEPFVLTFIAIGLIAFITSCFFDLTYTSGLNNELNVIGGPAINCLYVIFVPVGSVMIYVMFRYRKKASLFRQAPIWFFLVFYFLMLLLQYFYTDINDLTFMLGLTMVATYFTIVSQDSKLANDLEESKNKAEKANKDKTEFLSKMSHEIRTPMNTIMGFSESLKNKKDLTETEIREDVNNIYIAGNNLITIINNILDFSKLDSEKEQIDAKEYFIGDIIYELLSFTEARINKEKVKFNINADPNIPKVLYGDKQKIYKILLNIINNSIKYTDAGEINLSISSENKDNISNLTFTIKDTGTGIKEENYNLLFTQFSKIDTGKNSYESGAGLGLCICKKLVDLMGGTISFNSEFGIGTEFIINLQNKIVDFSPCGNFMDNIENTKFEDNDRVNCKGKRVLIVDDNDMNIRVAKKLLEKYNFEVISATSGEECIDLIKKQEIFDIILLDHMMPGFSGPETLKIIKKINENLPPVIAVTANMASDTTTDYIKEGFSDYLAKPIEIKKLNALINKYFKGGK